MAHLYYSDGQPQQLFVGCFFACREGQGKKRWGKGGEGRGAKSSRVQNPVKRDAGGGARKRLRVGVGVSRHWLASIAGGGVFAAFPKSATDDHSHTTTRAGQSPKGQQNGNAAKRGLDLGKCLSHCSPLLPFPRN